MRALKAAGLAAGATIGGCSAILTYGSVSKSSQLFGPSVYRGPGFRRSIALTFDDGPSESTPRLLEYLDKEGVTATFFQCGMNVRRLPRIAGEVAASGHQIGNHTHTHSSLLFQSRSFMEHEFESAQDAIYSATGVLPILLRPPYGLRWPGIRYVQHKLALLGVMWTVIGNDWRWTPDRIAARVITRATQGGIACLHDGRGIQAKPDISSTLAAVKTIVPVLRDLDYSFETVNDILR